jgi:transcriptional regulator with XRE-family HTH domain
MPSEQLALEAEMERSYVSDLERGTRNPSVQAIGRLADALCIEPAYLLEASHRIEIGTPEYKPKSP